MRVAVAVLLWLAPLSAHAELILSASDTRVAAGAPIQLRLTITNEDAAPLVLNVSEAVHVRLETDRAVATLPLTPDRAGPVEIAPGSFAAIQLEGSAPAGTEGDVKLTLTGYAANPIALRIESAPAAAESTTTAAPAAITDPRLVDKPPPLALSPYEPVYFIIGGDDGLNAKFQISLRYRLFDGRGRLAQRLNWIDDLYLSFTQTSLWDLSETSAPFRDSSYRPRLFFADDELARFRDGRLHFGVEAGVGHESNGKDGDDSRSFNMLYVLPTLTFGNPDGLRAYVAPLIHNYLSDSENPDLKDYRGYVDWRFGVGSKGGLDFWAVVRNGARSDYGSIEFNASYPLSKLSGGDLTGWIMLQYFNGYGESLLDYREKLDSQLRLGVAVAL